MKYKIANTLLVAATAVTATATETAVNIDTTVLERILDKYGFPIFCVVCCFYYIRKTQVEYREDYNNLHTTHAEEVKALTASLDANTEVLHRLRDTLEDIKESEV